MLTNSFAFTFEDSLIASKSIKKGARKKAHIAIKQEKIKVTTKEVLKRIEASLGLPLPKARLIRTEEPMAIISVSAKLIMTKGIISPITAKSSLPKNLPTKIPSTM